ncbi:CHRD domain-containing protein [Natronococcus sp.]|uniref:CHRD domain-containing protein n=1 Tax=Natronococcus sp. TaxID=35747 RepID=UPI003A4DFC2B
MTDDLRSRRWVLRATGVTVGSGLAVGTAGADADEETDLEDLPTTFVAELTDESVPRAVETNACGTATFEVDLEERAVHYVIDVEHLCDPTDVYVGYGADGESGARFVRLYPEADGEPAEGRFDGTLAEGTLTVDELLEAFERHDLETVATKLADREIYASVTTEAYPDGEIRGQIVPEDRSLEGSETDGGMDAEESDAEDSETEGTDAEESETEEENAEEADEDDTGRSDAEEPDVEEEDSEEDDPEEPVYRAPADPDDATDDEETD